MTREILLVSHTGRTDIAETAGRVARSFAAAGIGLRVLGGELDQIGRAHV